jgi:acetyl-CoA carboxylase carboxyltransferase component
MIREPGLSQSLTMLTGFTEEAATLIADGGSLFTVYRDGGVAAQLARVNGVACGIVTLAEETIATVPATHAARFIRFCDAFSLPIVTVVDAAAFSSIRGASRLSQAYSEATAPKITLIAGKAYGSVYIAVAGKRAGADVVLAWNEASVAALAPETAIHILWNDRLAKMQDPTKDRAALAEEFRTTECNAQKAAAQGGLTDVIAPEQTRASVTAFMEMLAGKRVSKLPKKHANIRL